MLSSADGTFCRACGMELQPVAELLRDQAPIVKTRSSTVGARSSAVMLWGLIITLSATAIGVSLKILSKENIHPLGDFNPYLSVIAIVAAIFGMGLMCYPLLQLPRSKTNPQTPALPKSEPTIRVRPALGSLEQASIVEQTTELLEASEARLNVNDTAPQSE